MSDLYLNREGAEGVVKSLEKQIEDLGRVAEAINKLITADLPEYWRGNSANSVQETYAEQYSSFLKNQVPETVTNLKVKMMGDIKRLIEADDR